MAGAARTFVGVDIGGTKTAVVAGLADSAGLRVIGRTTFPTLPEATPWPATLARICEDARSLLAAAALPGRAPAAVGVSCGGPLDSRAGVLLSPPNLPGWDRVPIVSRLQESLGCRTFLQNDANACALAEWRIGAGAGTRNMVFLTFGTGMGAGLILDGRLYEGISDLGGEVGHIRLAEDGPAGYGKTGSFEGYCSGGGIARLARIEAGKSLAAGRAVSFCSNAAALDSITARDVGEAAEGGDALAMEILATTGRYLGRGCAILMDILNPEMIVIGSIFLRCRRFLQASMDAEIAREALPGTARVCQIVPARLGESIGDFASLSVAVDGMDKAERGNSPEGAT
jgi:glucokinase